MLKAQVASNIAELFAFVIDFIEASWQE